jgi:hypothetical protein
VYLQIILSVFILTVVIHAVETLSYAVRLAGVRMGKLAVALSLTGIIVLVSRTSNLIQAPLTGKIIDQANTNPGFTLISSLQAIVMASSIGTLVAMLLFPSFVRLSSRLIVHLETSGSIPQMVRSSVSIDKLKHAKSHLRWPTWEMISRMRVGGIPKRLLLLNTTVTAFYTIGVLSALYASFLSPENAIAASQSSGLINGVATIVLTIFVDPQIALLTEKAMRGEASLETMNKTFGLLMFSRLCGTLLAQLLLVPCAYWIAWVVSLL